MVHRQFTLDEPVVEVCTRPLRISGIRMHSRFSSLPVFPDLQSPFPYLQAALCRFEDKGGPEALTIVALHEASVSLCSPGGSVYVVPLPVPGFRRLSPVPLGILVSSAPSGAPILLSHPFKARRPPCREL